MGANIVKPASSKDGSEKTEFSSNFNQQIDDISIGGECLSSTSVDKQLHTVASRFDSTNSTDQCIMIVLYDFSATLDSQLTVKRGEIVRLLGYSPAGDWSEVEAPSRLPNRSPRVAWVNGTNSGWVRGWVPTSYLTEHIRPTPPLSNATASQFTNAANWRTHASNESTLVASEDASTYPWYHGAVSRQAAEQLLRSGITGSYLVRESESAPGQLSVTVRNLGRVYHYRISRDTCGWQYTVFAGDDSHRSLCRIVTCASLLPPPLVMPPLASYQGGRFCFGSTFALTFLYISHSCVFAIEVQRTLEWKENNYLSPCKNAMSFPAVVPFQYPLISSPPLMDCSRYR